MTKKERDLYDTFGKGLLLVKWEWWVKLWGADYQVPMGFPILIYGDHLPNSYDDYIHEKGHVKQAIELFFVGMWLIYVGHYFWNRWARGMDHDTAYRNICFEREMYANQKNYGYLRDREFWAWRKYF